MALKLQATILSQGRTFEQGVCARIYRDTDWSEYRVRFFRDGQHMANADYHTDDKTDANDTARFTVDQLNNPPEMPAI